MTPLDHYRMAERLVDDAAKTDVLKRLSPLGVTNLLAAAQVHATLANAHMTAGVWGDDWTCGMTGHGDCTRDVQYVQTHRSA